MIALYYAWGKPVKAQKYRNMLVDEPSLQNQD